MRFQNPEAFRWLWLIPVLVGVVIWLTKRGRKKLESVFGQKTVPFLTASVSDRKRRAKLILWCLSLACFVIALARPQAGQSSQEVKARGIELMIAVDVSNSMLAEDVKPSRLEHAKAELLRLLDMLEGNKVGLIAFAGSAALLSPLTSDVSSLKMFVENLSVSSVANQGTNFHDALDEARSAFDRGGVESDEKLSVSKVILLISDGEDQEKGALDLAKKLSNEGVRIFSLAFGTERGGPIPMRDDRGYLAGYKRDRQGQNILSQVHGDFLRELAAVGQGAFQHATFGGMEAKKVRAELDKLEKAEFASSMTTNYEERFQIPLAIGIFLALGAFALGERRGSARVWRGRFEVAER